MRLVTYEVSGPAGPVRRTGALTPDGDVIDLAGAHAAHAGAGAVDVSTDMLEFLRGGEPVLDAARSAVDRAIAKGTEISHGRPVRLARDRVRLLAPLPRPNSIRQFSLIEAHMLAAIATMTRKQKLGGNTPALAAIPEQWYRIPAYFKSTVEEVYGPEDQIPWPSYTGLLDFELELAAVIGKRGRAISAANAADHIIGFTLFNDWSGRDVQQLEMSVNLGPGICKDFAASLGPCIVTPDEFDRGTARFTATVDGERWTDAALGMRLSFEDLLTAISQEATLMPGDVLTSGTVAGGCGIEHDRWLTEGARVVLGATGIGELANVVGVRGAGAPLPASQRAFTRAWASETAEADL